jgi:hypothetical protein
MEAVKVAFKVAVITAVEVAVADGIDPGRFAAPTCKATNPRQ